MTDSPSTNKDTSLDSKIDVSAVSAFRCGLEQSIGYMKDEELLHRIEMFKNTRGYKDITKYIEALILSERSEADRLGRIDELDRIELEDYQVVMSQEELEERIATLTQQSNGASKL